MTSVKYKLLPITIMGILIMGFVFGSMFINSEKETRDKFYLNEIQSAKKTFYNLEQNDIKMLKATLTDFMTNQAYKDLFMEGDRDKLYEASKDLYATHKELGITHFYYQKDGKVFLRVHSPAKYDDVLNRITYLKSVDTSSWGTGIELGQTAFALRVVAPYYNGDEMIGHVEFGEEIDHFNEMLHAQTGNNFATIVNKKYINSASWASVTETKGVRNNYNDLTNYVVIESTDPTMVEKGTECWNEDKVNSVSDEGNIFAKFNSEGKTYVCGGFALYDAAKNNVGAIIVIKDVTLEESMSAQNTKNSILITALLIIVIGVLVLFFTNKIVVNPIRKLTQAGNKISEGEIDTEIPVIKSKDEIQDLSETLGMLVSALKFLKGENSKKKK